MRPVEPQDAARLLVVHGDGRLEDARVRDLPIYLNDGDTLVFNDTRVIPAALKGTRLARDANGNDVPVDINLVGTYRFCQAFRDALSTAGGSIINVASMSSYASLPGVPGYGASKAGIVQLTMGLAETYAPKGIRVNGIAPGWIRSKMTKPVEADAQSSEAVLRHTPMARWGEPDDMAGPALFLASAAAGFVTGVTRDLSFGLFAQVAECPHAAPA